MKFRAALYLVVILLKIFLLFSLQGCKLNQAQTSKLPSDTTNVILPHPDHIIFVWMENKSFETIIGNSEASYINYLAKKGTLFTSSYALTHPSYPNYIQFFAGDALGVTSNNCIEGTPFAR